MEIKEFVTFNTVFIVFIYQKNRIFFSYWEICSGNMLGNMLRKECSRKSSAPDNLK